MDVWTVPLITVVLIICIIGFISVKKWNKAPVVAVDGQNDQISGPIEEHPFTLNPIIWIVLVAVLFIGIVIFYYAASS
ncbi:hypothetical protein I2483_07135 [Sporosarcina sp. E16_3]|uniref:hypothetical protein n=1 Tax=Sporosarcina sp. E16_3 TaxID=2789293 RepID=UPI001A915F38|nr:hypothetical protein [Sporosarcina sp. E16_3]MBO0601431.1 hypothetical protein [Sporosarcina sp. E16_3]